MSSLDCWWLGLRLWVSKIDIFYKHRPSFPSQSSILAYGSKTLYSRSSQLPLPCSALSCHFNHHWRRCCWIEKQNQNMRIGFHAVLCPVSCLLCPVSCVHSIKLGSTHTELCSPVNLHYTVQYFIKRRKISKLLLSLICAPKNKYSPSCGLYASPHLPLGLLAFHP